MNDILERRLELLNLEGKGFSQVEIVKILSQKWKKTERAIYYDFETRDTWQPLSNQAFERKKPSMLL